MSAILAISVIFVAQFAWVGVCSAVVAHYRPRTGIWLFIVFTATMVVIDAFAFVRHRELLAEHRWTAATFALGLGPVLQSASVAIACWAISLMLVLNRSNAPRS